MTNFRDHLSVVDGMPPLWPSSPRWPEDQQAFEDVMLLLPPQIAGFARMMTDNYVRQRKMDRRWRRFCVVADGVKGEGERTWGEWYEQVVRSTGWVVHNDGIDKERKLTGSQFSTESLELMKAGMFELDLDEDLVEDGGGGGLCDECKTPCESECMCGELFCSRTCMRKSWKSHKELCETVYENAGIAMTLTQLEFAKIRKVNVEACLGKTQADAKSALPMAYGAPRLTSDNRKKTKPNEPCPCHSGKKFKKCCGDPARLA